MGCRCASTPRRARCSIETATRRTAPRRPEPTLVSRRGCWAFAEGRKETLQPATVARNVGVRFNEACTRGRRLPLATQDPSLDTSFIDTRHVGDATVTVISEGGLL